MRCDNCGWVQNPAGSSNCGKCKSVLRGGAPQQSPRAGQPEMPPTSFQKTVQGRKAEMPAWDAPAYQPPSPVAQSQPVSSAKLNCNSCNYPNRSEATHCVDCGKPLSAQPQPQVAFVPQSPKQTPVAKISGTIDPYLAGLSTVFSLKPIARAREVITPQQPIVFNTGEKVALNRDNVDPGNTTITSQVQATVVLIDGKWHLVNNSAQQTSFVLAKEPIPLQKGDIILLGDRKFEFDC